MKQGQTPNAPQSTAQFHVCVPVILGKTRAISKKMQTNTCVSSQTCFCVFTYYSPSEFTGVRNLLQADCCAKLYCSFKIIQNNEISLFFICITIYNRNKKKCV